MNLDEQLKSALNEEADTRSGALPDVPRLIRGGRARRRRRNTVRAAGSVLAAVIAAGSLYGVVQLGEGDARSSDLSANQPTPLSLPTSDDAVPIESGTYVVPAGNGQVASYTVAVPAGWKAVYGNTLTKHWEGPGAIEISTFALDQIKLFDDACNGPETLGTAQSSLDSLVTGLDRQESGAPAGDPVTITLGGLPGARIELDVPSDRPRTGCRLGRGGLQVWRAQGDDYFVLFPDERASVYVVDVAGRAVVFVTKSDGEVSAADRAEVESIMGSIRFEG